MDSEARDKDIKTYLFLQRNVEIFAIPSIIAPVEWRFVYECDMRVRFSQGVWRTLHE